MGLQRLGSGGCTVGKGAGSSRKQTPFFCGEGLISLPFGFFVFFWQILKLVEVQSRQISLLRTQAHPVSHSGVHRDLVGHRKLGEICGNCQPFVLLLRRQGAPLGAEWGQGLFLFGGQLLPCFRWPYRLTIRGAGDGLCALGSFGRECLGINGG